MSTILPLLIPLAAAAPELRGVLLDHTGALITLEIPADAAPLEPGAEVAVYAAERRPDPRTGAPTEGLRYAGDGVLVWVGGDLAQVLLAHPDQRLLDGGAAVLGVPRRGAPTPPLAIAEPEAPEPAGVPIPPDPDPPSSVAAAESVGSSEPVVALAPPIAAPVRRGPRIDLGSVHDGADRHGGLRQGLIAGLDWADDGHQTGVGGLDLGWTWRPAKGPARVAVRLEGLRGARWVAADDDSGSEPWAREPAVGYWLWADLETGGLLLAADLGLAAGVQASGPTAGVRIGVRTGDPDGGHARVDLAQYGALGHRWTVTGAVPLSDRVRIGPRARVGALPLHEPPKEVTVTLEDPDTRPWQQQRADGVVRLEIDASHRLTVRGGTGLAAYDLLFADAGPVVDAAVEVRW